MQHHPSVDSPHQVSSRRWRLLPEGASRDAKILLSARAVRAFADGFVSVLLPVYLTRLGFRDFHVGAIAAATLAGSAALTLLVGLRAHRFSPRRLPLQGTVVL